MEATREAYGKKLAELGEIYPEIVVLDADLSCSTKTEVFAKKFPDRFFNMGVAEQDMMGTAAGLATCGKTVFVSTFAIFATGRAWEPFRQSIAYPHLNVKVCASHAGLTVGEDGASHQTVEDIATMRVIPGVNVIVPADAAQTRAVLSTVVRMPGPCYVRLCRAKSPDIFPSDYQFQIGRGDVLKKGNKLCLFTAGYLTFHALEAARLLEERGVGTSVVVLASIKPLDGDLVCQMAASHDHLVSVEEHSVIGGLGSAVAETLCARFPKGLLRLGVQDEFGQSGSYEEVVAHYGLDAKGIFKQICGAFNF